MRTQREERGFARIGVEAAGPLGGELRVGELLRPELPSHQNPVGIVGVGVSIAATARVNRSDRVTPCEAGTRRSNPVECARSASRPG